MNITTTFKRSITLSLTVLTIVGFAPHVFADTTAQHVAAIQAKGDTDITARITSLNSLVTKVNAAKKLSTSQKSGLTTGMQSEVTGLTTLKTTLDAETTVAGAKTDFQNIFAQHYIYAFFLPRTERIIAADNENDAAALLTSLVPKLQAYIAQAQTAGKDVTALNASLADMQKNVTAASTQSASVISTLTPLTASGYPGNKTTVTNASATIKTARTALEAARADAKSIIAGLKKALTTVQ
jgi:hypothetical protein